MTIFTSWTNKRQSHLFIRAVVTNRTIIANASNFIRIVFTFRARCWFVSTTWTKVSNWAFFFICTCRTCWAVVTSFARSLRCCQTSIITRLTLSTCNASISIDIVCICRFWESTNSTRNGPSRPSLTIITTTTVILLSANGSADAVAINVNISVYANLSFVSIGRSPSFIVAVITRITISFKCSELCGATISTRWAWNRYICSKRTIETFWTIYASSHTFEAVLAFGTCKYLHRWLVAIILNINRAVITWWA